MRGGSKFIAVYFSVFGVMGLACKINSVCVCYYLLIPLSWLLLQPDRGYNDNGIGVVEAREGNRIDNRREESRIKDDRGEKQ